MGAEPELPHSLRLLELTDDIELGKADMGAWQVDELDEVLPEERDPVPQYEQYIQRVLPPDATLKICLSLEADRLREWDGMEALLAWLRAAGLGKAAAAGAPLGAQCDVHRGFRAE